MIGLSPAKGCDSSRGDRLLLLGAKSGEIVVAALTGVLYREGSESGDVVSAGEAISTTVRCLDSLVSSRRGEYGGGGEATGSNQHR